MKHVSFYLSSLNHFENHKSGTENTSQRMFVQLLQLNKLRRLTETYAFQLK